jgi:hypothetical protein
MTQHENFFRTSTSSLSTSACDLGHSSCGHGPGNIIKSMTWRFKLVASALVMILLGNPLSAVASCWLHMAPAKHCTPHCPMMMMSSHAPSVAIQEAPANNSCCRVSAARPTPASIAQVPSVSGYVAPTFTASALDVPAVLTKAEPPDPLARASCPSLQSVFCTLLI